MTKSSTTPTWTLETDMPQSREERIRLHYRSLKKRVDYRRESGSVVWMQLARTWKMPIRELKALLKGRTD